MNILFIPPDQNQPSGLLYNFLAIEDLNQVAPTGYRVATLADVVGLIEYLGGEATAGGILKDTATWEAPNTGATNAKGFKALPDGWRDHLGAFAGILQQSKIWIDNR